MLDLLAALVQPALGFQEVLALAVEVGLDLVGEVVAGGWVAGGWVTGGWEEGEERVVGLGLVGGLHSRGTVTII